MTRTASILTGGLVAGTLDLLYAFIAYGPLSYGASPERVLHSVAAGWIGRDAARVGGMETAALGLLSHFTIAMLMAAVFVVAATYAPVLKRRAVAAGLIYGFVLYVTMNYLVVPLSAAHVSQQFATGIDDIAARLQIAFGAIRPENPIELAGTLFTHMALVGLPIALIARRIRA